MIKDTVEFIQVVVDASNEFHEQLKAHAAIEQQSFEVLIAEIDDLAEAGKDEDFDAKLVILGDKDDMLTMLEQYREHMD